ncbi:unnamed protein product [Rotaria sordida]|uniref:Uncharacterized protein n=1 Tax=Rotaria sordida TaxID=392033 RepID=A0A816C781_9BILA|nr:unnamed protein product [Rotaria sordida]CAF1619306.1 unnamed protein product [Rotaria sordida]
MPAIVLLNPEDIGSLARVLDTSDNSDEAVYWRERTFIVKIEDDEYICKPKIIQQFDESDDVYDSIADIPEAANHSRQWRKQHGIISDDNSEIASSDEQDVEAEDTIVNGTSESIEFEEWLQTENKTASKTRALSTTSLSSTTPSSIPSLSVSGCSSSITVMDEFGDVVEDEELAIAIVAEKEAAVRAKMAMEMALQAAKEAEEIYKKVSMLRAKKPTKKTVVPQIDEIYTYETAYEPMLTTISNTPQTMSTLADIEIIIDDIVVVIETLDSAVNLSIATIDTVDAIVEVVSLVHN